MDISSIKDKLEVVLKTEENHENEIYIDFRHIFKVIFNGKWIIAVIVAICLLATTVYSYLSTSYIGQARMMIAFNFEGIEKGLDPHGQKFDMDGIKSPAVISKAIEKLGMDKKVLTADVIRRNIVCEPVIPGDITEKIKQLEEARKQNIKGLQEFTYIPNQYIIAFNIPKSLGISKANGRDILAEVLNQYKQNFFYTYSDMSLLSNALETVNYEDYDYPDASMIMKNQVNVIYSFLDNKSKEKEAKSFRSQKTGLTFEDIEESVNVINSVDTNRLDSLIYSNRLTKDKDKLIKSLEYRLRENVVKKTKNEDEARIVNDLINKYQKDKNLIMMAGGGQTNDESSMLELNKTDEYYNSLIERSANSSVGASRIYRDNEELIAKLELYRNDDVPIEIKKTAEKDVQALINTTKQKLDKWVKLTNDTLTDYYKSKKFTDAITELSPAEVYSVNTNRNMMLIISILIGLILGIAAVLIKDFIKNDKGTAVKA